MHHRIPCYPLLCCLLLALATGCSTYHRDARAASGRDVPEGSIEGRWTGSWRDAKREKHGGELDCVLTRNGDHLYRMSSRSRWWKWFTSSMDVSVVVTPVAPGEYLIKGGRHIWGFGDYSLDARVDAQTFKGTYEAAGYRGFVDLHRPPT